jgi:CheY-like chemotaxis protein
MTEESVVTWHSGTRQGPGTVLYIEDNVSNLHLMQRVVQHRPGVELLHAADGHSGLSVLRERHPDLVFLDLHLPDVPGEEVLRQILAEPSTCDISVVVLSADATPGQRKRLLAGGAVAYLTKPLDITEVLQVLDRELRAADK